MPFTKTGEYIFDKLDLRILKMFADLNGKQLSGWKMMMTLFPDAKSKSEKISKYQTMNERIENHSKLGIIDIKERRDGSPIWEVSDEQVCFKKLRMPNGLKSFVGVCIDESWQVMEIN